MAEWFEAFATLPGVPAAVVFGVRQLRSTGAVLELERRQLVAEEQERTERRRAEQAILHRAVSLPVGDRLRGAGRRAQLSASERKSLRPVYPIGSDPNDPHDHRDALW